MQTRKGTELYDRDREHVLASYCHRMTVEAQRRWPDFAARMRAGGWRMPDRTDAEWLAATDFRVTRTGALDRRVTHCFSQFS